MRQLAAVALALVCACGDDDPYADEQNAGGDATIVDRTSMAYSHPAPNLAEHDLELFMAGIGPFDFQWQLPQLGPLYNDNGCFACHNFNGRGASQIGNGAEFSQALVRVSAATGTPEVPGGDVPYATFGTQLQDHANVGVPEVVITQSWISSTVPYGDGTTEAMRAPMLVINTPDGNPLPADALTSYRQSQPLLGLGLLDAVPDATIEALADPTDANGDGIEGHTNTVWNATTMQMELGRFGHKATEPTVRQQIAHAFLNDIGLTNQDFPASDGTTDVPMGQLDTVTVMVSAIAVPAGADRDATAKHGRDLFEQFRCSGCHVATLVTGTDQALPEFANQTIHPFTDLLLHDMGDGLADGRPDFQATGSEWRTPPLWGIGLAQLVNPAVTFLHDGRALTLAQAVLWHGGEAQAARDAFAQAGKSDRDALVAFLQSL
ncbi:MAG TPA: di-heme oxidoredictase family protein [Kofleriaceae bacterium]